MDQARQFLEALFAGKSDQEFILIWLAEGRRSAWFRDIQAAADYVHQHSTQDVYVGVALSPADHGTYQRLKIEGGERMPSSIVGLWADIDILGPGHTKTNLPSSAEEARSVLFPKMPPSLIVHSGGGLQAWWLFKEPWTLESEEEIRRAGALAVRWINAIRSRAAIIHGWDIDAVGDLTRVLRVPDTTNKKVSSQPRPVRLIELNEYRYNQSDLEEYLDIIGADRAPLSAGGAQDIAPITGLQYSHDANPPFEGFQALYATDSQFRSTWDHSRGDLQDQSTSAFDMALANIAVQANWSDQEIANLLIAHRRRYGKDLKLRDSYYGKTIAKARAAFDSDRAFVKLREIMDPAHPSAQSINGESKYTDADGDNGEPGAADLPDDTAQWKAVLVESINALLKFPARCRIIRIKRYTSEPSKYQFQAVFGPITIGTIADLVDWTRLHHRLLDATGHSIPRFPTKQWDEISQALRRACVNLFAGEESTEAGETMSWLWGYLTSGPILDAFDEKKSRSPYMHKGRIHIDISDLSQWIRLNHDVRIQFNKLCPRLRQLGARQVKFSLRRTSHQVWALPKSFTAARANRPSPARESPAEEDRVD